MGLGEDALVRLVLGELRHRVGDALGDLGALGGEGELRSGRVGRLEDDVQEREALDDGHEALLRGLVEVRRSLHELRVERHARCVHWRVEVLPALLVALLGLLLPRDGGRLHLLADHGLQSTLNGLPRVLYIYT